MSSLSKFKLKKTHTFVSPSQIKECSAAGGGGGWGGERTNNTSISTEGSGMPTKKPQTGNPV